MFLAGVFVDHFWISQLTTNKSMDAELKGVDFGNQDVLKTEGMFIKGAPAWRMTWKHWWELSTFFSKQIYVVIRTTPFKHP